jgi:hypothetical protein
MNDNLKIIEGDGMIDWWKARDITTTSLIGSVEVLKADIMKTVGT